MVFTSVTAVFFGAGCGACLRWWLGTTLNPIFPTLPFGTLAANLIGGYLVGLAAVTFSVKSGLPPEIRLLVITGLLGVEKFRGVRLVMSENALGIVCNNNEQEEAADEIEVSYNGEPLDVGFNVTYLLDGLGALGSEEIILSLADANSSMLLTSEGEAGFNYVVMPMRI